MEQPPPAGGSHDDTGSVSSQGSRRSSRLLDKKRPREEEEDAPAVGRPSSRQRRRLSNSPAAAAVGVRTSARRASLAAATNTASTPMDLEPIPEEVSTKRASGAATAATPPPKVKAQLPPVTPGRLVPRSATTAHTRQPAAAAAEAIAPPKSSKKLISLDHKADTPFKRANVNIRHEDNEEEGEEKVAAHKKHGDDDFDKAQAAVDLLPPEEPVPLIPQVPLEEPPPLPYLLRFGQGVWHRHGHMVETLRFWLLLFFVLQILCYPLTIHPILSATTAWSRRLLPLYQAWLLPPPPPDQSPVLQQLQDDLTEIHNREKQTIRLLLHKRTELQTLVQSFVAQGQADLATYQASLPPVVNLSTTPPLTLWHHKPDSAASSCPENGSGMSVADAAASIRETYRKQLAAGLDHADVPGWIQQFLPSRGTADRNLVRLRQTITDRIERERADVDYTFRVVAATGNVVDQLPWLNRLAALWGWRFYGHGATAALLPNRPPGAESSFRGQCWALQPTATMTIELSNSIYVQSVAVEHPAAVVAPKTSAIRQFAVYAIDATLRQWPLGNFTYQNEPGGRQDYLVRDEYQGEEIPPVRVVKLVVSSGWNSVGDDDDAATANVTTCLYRFRVFGEQDEEKPKMSSSDSAVGTEAKLVHGKNWGH